MRKQQKTSRHSPSGAPTAAVAEVLIQALKQAGLTDQAHRLAVCRIWNSAVGPRIAAHTSLHSFSRGVLVVKAATSPWQSELTFLRHTIVEKINAMLGHKRVQDLRIIGGHVPPPATPTAATAAHTPAPSPQDARKAAQTAHIIADSEVRQAFEHLMMTALAAARAQKPPQTTPTAAPPPTLKNAAVKSPATSAALRR